MLYFETAVSGRGQTNNMYFGCQQTVEEKIMERSVGAFFNSIKTAVDDPVTTKYLQQKREEESIKYEDRLKMARETKTDTPPPLMPGQKTPKEPTDNSTELYEDVMRRDKPLREAFRAMNENIIKVYGVPKDILDGFEVAPCTIDLQPTLPSLEIIGEHSNNAFELDSIAMELKQSQGATETSASEIETAAKQKQREMKEEAETVFDSGFARSDHPVIDHKMYRAYGVSKDSIKSLGFKSIDSDLIDLVELLIPTMPQENKARALELLMKILH